MAFQADAVFENGTFHTLASEGATVSAIAVLHGRIIAVDADATALEAKQRHDLGGAIAVPGFHDAHQHLTGRGKALNSLDLVDPGIDSLQKLYDAVEQFVLDHPEKTVIIGRGYDQFRFGEVHPDRESLDKVAAGKPVYLEHVSGHMGVVNTAAFEACGYTDMTAVPDVDGGYVDRDEHGAVTGLLQEKAKDLVRKVAKFQDVAEIEDNIAAAAALALSQGTTMITEPGLGAINGIGSSEVDFAAYQNALEHGRLGLRAVLMPYLTTLHPYTETGEGRRGLDLGIRTGFGNEFLRMGPVKVLTDGSLLGRSSAMHDCFHGHDQAGFMLWDVAELEAMLTEVYAAGYALSLHAIGDRAVDHAMDILEKVQNGSDRTAHRNRIEHYGVSTLEQVQRAADLGITPVPQGSFVSILGDNMMDALGPERSAGCYRMKAHLNAGNVLPGSSDCPVADGRPLLGIHDMVNRLTSTGVPCAPEEALTPYEAFRAYSYGSAYAAGIEDEFGTLEVGKFADFAVLSEDPFAIDPSGISAIDVTTTVVGGEVKYSIAG